MTTSPNYTESARNRHSQLHIHVPTNQLNANAPSRFPTAIAATSRSAENPALAVGAKIMASSFVRLLAAPQGIAEDRKYNCPNSYGTGRGTHSYIDMSGIFPTLNG
jgi:hypothetical protein